MGTTLALTGAYILAGELMAHEDPQAAFGQYEHRMRPLVAEAQRLFPGAPQVTMPRSRAHRTALHAALRMASTPLAQRLGKVAGRFEKPRSEAIALPEYA
ncbi:hypothetical protein [Amycolatopsis sp. La24]|nr:hypothetical protein [Amycolatopsis sp. La24]